MTARAAIRTFFSMVPYSYVSTAFSERERPRRNAPPRRASPAQRSACIGVRGVRIGALAGGLVGLGTLVTFIAL